MRINGGKRWKRYSKRQIEFDLHSSVVLAIWEQDPVMVWLALGQVKAVQG